MFFYSIIGSSISNSFVSGSDIFIKAELNNGLGK